MHEAGLVRDRKSQAEAAELPYSGPTGSVFQMPSYQLTCTGVMYRCKTARATRNGTRDGRKTDVRKEMQSRDLGVAFL